MSISPHGPTIPKLNQATDQWATNQQSLVDNQEENNPISKKTKLKNTVVINWMILRIFFDTTNNKEFKNSNYQPRQQLFTLFQNWNFRFVKTIYIADKVGMTIITPIKHDLYNTSKSYKVVNYSIL